MQFIDLMNQRSPTNKLAIVSNQAGSLIKFRLDLLKAFKNLGYQIVAFAPDINSVVIDILNDYQIRFIQIPMSRDGLNPISNLISIYNLYKFLKKEKPDEIILYTIKPVLLGSVAASLAKVRHIYSIVTGLGYVFISESIKAKILRFFVEKIYTFAFKLNKKVFFMNLDDKQLFVNKSILSSEKAILINGSGVNIDYYAFTQSFPKEVTFLFIGRLINDKGINEFITAVRKLKSKYPQIVCKLVGPLDDNPAALCQNELDKIVDEKIIHYLGHLEDVRPTIVSSSVLVLPSYREGVPRSVLEAMSIGRPIITTDAPGCRETVVDGLNGFLVPVKDSESLAAAMEKFILNPELIASMGLESRKIVEEKFDVYKVNEIVINAMNIL